MSMLTNTMEPQISRLYMLLESSKAIWEKMKNLYGQQKNFAQIFNLKQELSQIKSSKAPKIALITQPRCWPDGRSFRTTFHPWQTRKKYKREQSKT